MGEVTKFQVTLSNRAAAVSGILNGVDEDHWDSRRDPALAQQFDMAHVDKRKGNRKALIERFRLAPAQGPLFGVVSRLSEQKGLDLLIGALPALLETGGSLVLLGSGDASLENAFRAAAERHPDRVGVELAYDDAMSHLITGGSDAIVVPSRFEPCGLTQLYALRYGAVPVVRRTGGLGDTVVDASDWAIAAHTATGVVFDHANVEALSWAINRTAQLYANKPIWRGLQRTGMQQRFSWADAAERYDALYRSLGA